MILRKQYSTRNSVFRKQSFAQQMIWLCLLLLGFTGTTQAQLPCFTIDGADAACAPARFVLRNCVVGTNVFYIPDSTNPAFIINGRPAGVDTVRYTTPGKYRLGQGILVGGVNRYLYKNIYVLRPRTPVPRVLTCDNFLVQVRIPKIEGERFVIDYGTGVFDTTDSNTDTVAVEEHRYNGANPNPATIRVRSLYNCGRDTTLSVQLRTALLGPNDVTARLSRTGEFRIFLTASVDFRVRMQVWNGTTYQAVTTTSLGNNVFGVQGANLLTGRRFRLQCLDDCGTLVAEYEFGQPAVQYQPVNRANRLTLTQPFPQAWPATTTVVRNGVDIRTLALPALASEVLWDSTASCGRLYCYAVQQRWQQPYGTSGRSTQFNFIVETNCAVATSNQRPAMINTLSVSYLNNNPVLTWRLPTTNTVSKIFIQRFRGTRRIPNMVDSIPGNATRYEDQAVNYHPDSSYRYFISYRDSCTNTSFRFGLVEPIHLKMRALSERRATLSWNAPTGWLKAPQAYRLQYLDLKDRVLENVPISADSLTYLIQGRYAGAQLRRFRIGAIPDTAVLDTVYSNILELKQTSNILMPNAFSPNKDNINDKYVLQVNFLKNYRLSIKDRWGSIVFESTDPTEGWDGTVNGNQAPIGVYSATVSGKDELEQPISASQLITLIR